MAGERRIDPVHLLTVARLTAAILVTWSISGGLYLTLGGSEYLSAPQWKPLVAFAHGYHLIGGSLLLFGAIGLLAAFMHSDLLAVIHCALCATWCMTVAIYLEAAALTVPHAGNFSAFSVGLCAIVFMLRIVLLWAAPENHR